LIVIFILFFYFFRGSFFALFNFNNEYPICQPNIPFNSKNKFEFNPKEHKSFDVGLIGSIVDSSIEFVPYNGTNIIISSKILISSEKVKNSIKVGSRIQGERYQWGVKGPSFFVDHGECASAKVLIHMPEKLKEYEEIVIKITGEAKVNTNYGDINLKTLRIDVHKGSLQFQDKRVHHLVLDSHYGDIKAKNITAGSVYLATGKGDIEVKETKSFSFSANNRNGLVRADIIASRAFSSVLNGDIKLKVRDLGSKERRNVGGKAVNGKVNINIVGPYHGSFMAFSLNGETKVKDSKKNDLSFDKNWTRIKKGFKGSRDIHSDSHVFAKTLNGKTKIIFS